MWKICWSGVTDSHFLPAGVFASSLLQCADVPHHVFSTPVTSFCDPPPASFGNLPTVSAHRVTPPVSFVDPRPPFLLRCVFFLRAPSVWQDLQEQNEGTCILFHVIHLAQCVPNASMLFDGYTVYLHNLLGILTCLSKWVCDLLTQIPDHLSPLTCTGIKCYLEQVQQMCLWLFL